MVLTRQRGDDIETTTDMSKRETGDPYISLAIALNGISFMSYKATSVIGGIQCEVNRKATKICRRIR